MAIAPNSRAARHIVWALAFGASLARADSDFQFSVDGGIGTTDNILRTPVNEQSEDLASLGAQLSLQHETRKFTADLLADLVYAHYSNDTYDNEVTGNFMGSAQIALLPERINWVFEDNFGQSVPDPLAAVTPDNQENVNVFATGPDFFVPLGSANHLGLSARYMQTEFEENPFGSERYSAMLYVGRELSSSALLSLRGSAEQVTPEDESTSEEYDVSELYARYSIEGGRSTLSVEGGGTRIERGEFSDSGPLLRFSISREITTRSTLRATLGREFSDAGSALRFGQEVGGIDTDTSAVASNSDPFVSEYATLGWSASGRRTRLGLSASYVDEDYPQQGTSNRSRLQFGARLSRDFGPRLTWDLTGFYSDEDMEVADGDSKEATFGTGLSWRVGRTIFVDLFYELTERSADNPVAEFDEQRAWLRLRYGAEPERRIPAAPESAD